MILWLLCTQYPLDGLSLRTDILHDIPVYPAGHWQCRKLVGSSLKKMICGNYTPSFLLSSTGSVFYELRRQFVVVNNLSQMYAMLGGQWPMGYRIRYWKFVIHDSDCISNYSDRSASSPCQRVNLAYLRSIRYAEGFSTEALLRSRNSTFSWSRYSPE